MNTAAGSRDVTGPPTAAPAAPPQVSRLSVAELGPKLEPVLVLFALTVSLALFGAFVAIAGHNPLDVYAEMYRGAFGTWFSFQNTPAARCAADADRRCAPRCRRALGLMVIGGEGALVMGGLAAGAIGRRAAGRARRRS